MTNRRTYLLTGATGYVGSIALDALLEHEDCNIVVLIRRVSDKEKIVNELSHNAVAQGRRLEEIKVERIHYVLYEAVADIPSIYEDLRTYDVNEIIHCAGCVDYYDTVELQIANVDFTQLLLNYAQDENIDGFVFVSTAYSSGYRDGVVSETPHDEPASDPTKYTVSKRHTENIIIKSGVPYKILRPSIVIGDSKTGRYVGKRYGLYQQWIGIENLLCDRYHSEIHLVGPKQQLNFVHQDAFRAAFVHALSHLPYGSVMHVTSDPTKAPTMRELWEMWLTRVSKPQRTIFYQKFDQIPLKEIHSRQRAYLTFAAVNLEIASHEWLFDTSHLDNFRKQGLVFADATKETIAHCQERFVGSSEKISAYLDRFQSELAESIEYVDQMPEIPINMDTIGHDVGVQDRQIQSDNRAL